MVALVQRPRGPRGFNPIYRHLPWPSDVTPEQFSTWCREWMLGASNGGQFPPTTAGVSRSLKTKSVQSGRFTYPG